VLRAILFNACSPEIRRRYVEDIGKILFPRRDDRFLSESFAHCNDRRMRSREAAIGEITLDRFDRWLVEDESRSKMISHTW